MEIMNMTKIKTDFTSEPLQREIQLAGNVKKKG